MKLAHSIDNVADAAARAAFKGRGNLPPAPQQVPVQNIFKDYFGLSVPVLNALLLEVAPCLCGNCQGGCVQIAGRMHFLKSGMPEMIKRPAEGDAAKVAALCERIARLEDKLAAAGLTIDDEPGTETP